jgi:biotin-(acetyl-CoA carboxylase) ligase
MVADSPFQVRLYTELDSTNEEAKRLLAQGEIQRPTILRAACQTTGRGTQGRQWFSPPGAGLYFSIVHPFETIDTAMATTNAAAYTANDSTAWERLSHAPLTPLFTLAAGVACAETLGTLTGLTIQLKPINDLYLENRKLGGILTESLVSDNRCRALITGIGINIREHQEIERGCTQEDRGNRPISLQTCIAPQLFNQWHPDALLEELSQSIALAVNAQYGKLAAGQAQTLLANYQRYKLPEFDLPDGIEAMLSNGDQL